MCFLHTQAFFRCFASFFTVWLCEATSRGLVICMIRKRNVNISYACYPGEEGYIGGVWCTHMLEQMQSLKLNSICNYDNCTCVDFRPLCAFPIDRSNAFPISNKTFPIPRVGHLDSTAECVGEPNGVSHMGATSLCKRQLINHASQNLQSV